jgi:hypothetical protein
MAKISPKLLDELENVIDVSKSVSNKRTVPVIFDGKQFTLKIPKKFAVRAGMKKDQEFEFEVVTRIVDGTRKAELVGRLK